MTFLRFDYMVSLNSLSIFFGGSSVLLEAGEANLPKQSVVVVSQVSTVDKTKLGEYIGSLNEQRIKQILAGMQFLQLMTERRETGEKSNGQVKYPSNKLCQWT